MLVLKRSKRQAIERFYLSICAAEDCEMDFQPSSEEDSSEASDMQSSTDENGDNTDDQQQEYYEQPNDGGELQQLQRECRAMLKLLKRLREEEQDWREKNQMLAREALLCGFQIESLETPPTKRRLKSPAAKKEEKTAPNSSWCNT